MFHVEHFGGEDSGVWFEHRHDRSGAQRKGMGPPERHAGQRIALNILKLSFGNKKDRPAPRLKNLAARPLPQYRFSPDSPEGEISAGE
jgi:hypothetical protein